MDNSNLIEILDCISPSDCNYQEWVNVGMALKYEGFTIDDWDAWSQSDSRYHSGECAKKWTSFVGSNKPVTAGTIVQMAKEHGWKPTSTTGFREYDWNDEIRYEEGNTIFNTGEGIIIDEPVNWNPAQQIITYLETLFEASENVGYVTEAWEKNEDDKVKYLPTKGCCDRTAGELIQQLNLCNDDIGAVIGDYNPNAGAWVRFNPLDGKGVKNENVTDFRYALVESDSMPIEQQNAVIRELELPVAILINSGGKSIHAIVKIDAPNYDEYRKRVDYLYKICRENGFDIDKQNCNPSRLSRLPGIMRNGKKQFIIDKNIGKNSFDDWKDYVESINDDLPDIECLSSEWNNLPDLAQPLIDGVLRQGHKMLIAGPSKAGKSFALIELCISIAEGEKWIGFNCAKGKVMYVNLELDRASCLHRFKDVYTSMGLTPNNLINIDIWNLRGKSVPMDKLAPKLIRRANKKNYIAIVIDPIYKVITGDENSADQMANFCNQFDKICTELGTAVIYCHHHSKGGQGGKKSMDRASGSGVFARDPDALLDLSELEISESLLKQQTDKQVCKICAQWLQRFVDDFDSVCSQDDLESSSIMLESAKNHLPFKSYNLMIQDIENAKQVVKNRTAWRIEGTLREFPKFNPLNLWFDYPIHKIDDASVLKDASVDGDNGKPVWQKAQEARKKSAQDKREKIRIKFENAVNLCNAGDEPTVKDIAEYLDTSERNVRDWIKKYDYWIDKNSGAVKKKESENGQ